MLTRPPTSWRKLFRILPAACGLIALAAGGGAPAAAAPRPVAAPPAAALAASRPAVAPGLVWSGDPAGGTKVFKNLNCISPGSVTVATDPVYGRIWDFSKPAGDHRCEAHGAAGFTPGEGDTYYIGWRSKLTSLANDNANFQWKAYGRPMLQNFPLVIKNIGGRTGLYYSAPGTHIAPVFQTTLTTNTWHSHVLLIHVSRSAAVGYVGYWLDGKQVTFAGGATQLKARTFDGTSVDPKWGVYGGDPGTMHNFVQ